MKPRSYSQHTMATINLLAKQIQLGRKLKKWSEADLANRANISRTTLRKIEQGDLNVAIGLFFEVAVLVDITLYQQETSVLNTQLGLLENQLTLVPKRIRKHSQDFDDDF